MKYYFLLVKEVLKNIEYIWDTTPVPETDLANSLKRVSSQLKSDVHLTINFHSRYAEVIKEETLITFGMLWNTSQHIQEVLYVVSAIPINSIPKSVTVETQTEATEATESTESDIESNTYAESTESSESADADAESTESNESNEQVTRPFYISSGYSNNILFPWNDNFKIELEEKLLLPNLGLRPTDQVYHSSPSTSNIVLDYDTPKIL
jgi:hypothetical protein